VDGVHFHDGIEHIIVFLGQQHAHLVGREAHGIRWIGDWDHKLPRFIGDASLLAFGEAILEVAMNGIQVAVDARHLEQKRICQSRLTVLEIFCPLAVYVLPIALSPHPATQFLTHARTIVLAIDPEASGPADPALVRDVLGLTLGEARMAALVGSGLAPREASKKLGITEETVRSVLKQVFSKTGVSRQSELVSLLSKLVL